MDIIQWNPNGFYSHIGELQILIAQNNPEIICIQETRFKPNQTATLKNYSAYQKNREDCLAASGGVAIFIKNNRHSHEIPLQTELEAIAIETYLPNKLTICCLYLPPNRQFTFQQLMNLTSQLPEPFILLGDFNSHNQIWGSNYTDRKGTIIEELVEDYLTILNDGTATHICSRTGTMSCIDLTICTPTLTPNLNWQVMQLFHGGGHIPIKISINSGVQDIIDPKINTKWNINTADWELFQNKLKNTILIVNPEDIDETTTNFTQNIIKAAEISIKQTIPKNNKRNTPWWNPECAIAVRENKKAFYKYKRYPTEENFINFKRSRAVARRIIITSKQNSWKQYVSTINSSTPTSKVWEKIRKIKGTNTIRNIPTIVDGLNIIHNPIDVTEKIATQFQYNSSNDGYDINFLIHKQTREQEEITIENCPNRINDDITFSELLSAIRELKLNRSPGPDTITTEMLQNLPHNTLEDLLRLFNLIWKKNSYPKSWKEAITIPILKPNQSKTETNSYRPITITNTLSKLLQKIVNHRLTWYLEKNHLLSNSQSGFRKCRSTMDNILTLTCEIYKAFENKQSLTAVFFDLHKAYDMTWRYSILKNLKEYGLNGHILHYVKNFLTDRTFRVKANGHLSTPKMQVNGLPQGEILSVTLFLVAINKIFSYIPNDTKFELFADDLVLYTKNRNINTITGKLQSAINNLQTWCMETGFKFSPNKTKAIVFTNKRLINLNPLIIHNTNIQYVKQIRFLGMILDSKLKWSPHIDNVKRECSQRNNLLKTLGHQKWGAEKETLIMIYKALIRSKLDYGSFLYMHACKSALKKLDSIQNTALRISSGAFRTSPTLSIACETGEAPLHYRRNKLALTYIARLAQNPVNPAYKYFFLNEQNELTFQTYSPLQKFIRNFCQIHNLSIPPIEKITHSEVEPWIRNQPKYNLTLNIYKKRNTQCHIYVEKFNKLKEYYNDHIHIYTDGSKQNNCAGAAVVSEGETFRYRLPTKVSNYTAEAFSLQQAIQRTLRDPQPHKYIIFSDSISIITATQQLYPPTTIVKNIQESIHQSIIQGNSIVLAWVPSHVGIQGNELADIAAKQAASPDAQITPINIPASDITHTFKSAVNQLWNDEWRSQHHNKLNLIKKTTENWIIPLTRQQQIKITRLRIGHCLLTHRYILEQRPPDICDQCDVELSVTHIITDCPKFQVSRRKFHISEDITTALGNSLHNIKNIIEFLKDVGLYDQI